ncbi:MAG TPA: MFS transporter, partial [Chloroflexota bacterium]|nr:MFS transporter [Chloroflexota bacterium]
GFFVWEGRAREPLVDLGLFRSAAFTWGVVLAGIGGLAMIGVLFTMPQYFQGVNGVDAMASGVRLLPLIGGLVLGAVPADRVAGKLGAKMTVALGFVALAAGLVIGGRTSTVSEVAFVAGWMALVGLGMGLTLATSAACALSALPEERSGVGSAVMQAAQKVGGPFGSAILGSVLSAGYVGHLDLAGLPPATASAVRSGIFGGLAVGRQVGEAGLLDSVRAAFVNGMDAALMVSAGIAIAGLVLTLAFLPGSRAVRSRKREAVLAA